MWKTFSLDFILQEIALPLAMMLICNAMHVSLYWSKVFDITKVVFVATSAPVVGNEINLIFSEPTVGHDISTTNSVVLLH